MKVEPGPSSYRELGSVEGFVKKVELDGHGRPLLWMTHRIDRQLVKCILQDRVVDRIGRYEVADVLNGMRLQVFGLIHYKDIDKVNYVDVEDIHIFEADDQLPGLKDIIDPDFTQGVEAVEYIRRRRLGDV